MLLKTVNGFQNDEESQESLEQKAKIEELT